MQHSWAFCVTQEFLVSPGNSLPFSELECQCQSSNRGLSEPPASAPYPQQVTFLPTSQRKCIPLYDHSQLHAIKLRIYLYPIPSFSSSLQGKQDRMLSLLLEFNPSPIAELWTWPAPSSSGTLLMVSPLKCLQPLPFHWLFTVIPELEQSSSCRDQPRLSRFLLSLWLGSSFPASLLREEVGCVCHTWGSTLSPSLYTQLPGIRFLTHCNCSFQDWEWFLPDF